MNHPVEKASLPASLNAMTALCAVLSTAAAGITGVSFVLPHQSATSVISGPTLTQPQLEETPPLVVAAGPMPAVEEAIKPNPNIKDVLNSVEPPKVESHSDLAEAFKTGTELEKKKPVGEGKKNKDSNPRQVVRVIAPEHKELPQSAKTAEGGMPLPAVSSKPQGTSKEEPAQKVAKIVPPSAMHSEQPQNFKPLDLAQKAAEQKQPASTTKSPSDTSYVGPTIVAVSVDRVWVRVGETRTAVLVVGDNLQGIGKVTAIQNGVVKFENGLAKSVGDIIK